MRLHFYVKKIIASIIPAFFILMPLFSQEALKSTQEEYYDFLSLSGLVERPTLGYRTLSDSVWTFNEVESFEENEDGTFTKVRIPGKESDGNIWKNNNLGRTYTLWTPSKPADNWFTRGLKQGLTAKIYGPEWFNSYNSAAPYGQNDGALWQGKGYNTALTSGLRLEGYGFEMTFKPQISFSQNLEFEYIPGVYGDTHSYNWAGNVDLVQRYGDYSFSNFDWGDSEIRWTWNALTFGFGNQSPWLGPAKINPMLGSNNAASYTKFDVGLRKLNITLPYLNWDLGNIEGRIWLGKLQESDYFDNDESNNERMLWAMSASYEPLFIPGLTIGVNRIFITYWRPENYSYFLRLFTLSRSNALSSSGNDEDQKISLFVQWYFPKVGFKVYGEYGFDDFSGFRETDTFHTAIYTVGINQKNYLPFDLTGELSFEWNNFEMSQDFQFQWTYMGYYAHGFVKQGYTNKGQIIGSGSSYFGNSQFLQYKVYYPKGYIALKIHRYSPNNNSIYSQAINTSADGLNGPIYKKWYGNFETYYCFGIESQFLIINDISIKASYDFTKIYCRNYDFDNTTVNHNFTLTFNYQI